MKLVRWRQTAIGHKARWLRKVTGDIAHQPQGSPDAPQPVAEVSETSRPSERNAGPRKTGCRELP